MTELEKAADRIAYLYGKILSLDGCDLAELDELLDLTSQEGLVCGELSAKQSPWISVEERLPEPHTKVFFIVRYTDHVSHYVGFWHNGEWETDDRIFTPNSKYSKTTHWMPIPE